VVVELPEGTAIVSLVTDESVKLLDLKVGDTICACSGLFGHPQRHLAFRLRRGLPGGAAGLPSSRFWPMMREQGGVMVTAIVLMNIEPKRNQRRGPGPG
jgi:hypothetical protein